MNATLSNDNADGKKRFNLSLSNTCILLNETTSEIRQYAATNFHIALSDSASPVTAARRASVLSNTRPVENELLVFGNHEGTKVECVENLNLEM